VPDKERTLTAGIAGRRPYRSGAFTVLEVLVVIALIALLTGVLVTGSARMANGQAATPEDVFWKAVLETRKAALLSGSEVRLTFTDKDKERALVAKATDGTEQRFPFEWAGELKMDFLSTQKGTSSILLGGQAIETQTIPFVTFYGDGTCSPFRLQIRTSGEARVLAIDPWTCALVLPAAAPLH
jgi:type II secretory pathway pseudopilin PulG